MQRLGRAQARQGLRLEELENKLEAGFAELRAALAQAAPASQPRWDDLLDAADALDEAAAGAREHSVAEGLKAVNARLERFLAGQHVRRVSLVGAPPDPALVRVVGTLESAAVRPGTVARVVRAAVTERGRLLREGEVLVASAGRSE